MLKVIYPTEEEVAVFVLIAIYKHLLAETPISMRNILCLGIHFPITAYRNNKETALG